MWALQFEFTYSWHPEAPETTELFPVFLVAFGVIFGSLRGEVLNQQPLYAEVIVEVEGGWSECLFIKLLSII